MGNATQRESDRIADPTGRGTLSPIAYSEAALPALKLARSSRLARIVAIALFCALVVGTCFVAFAPWQQSVKGSGNVIAYAPLERRQVLQTPIKGRIVRLGEGIYENAYVNKGDLIAEISDFDPAFLIRLERQVAAARQQVSAANSVLEANQRKRETAKTIVSSLEAQVAAYRRVKEQVVAAAEATVAAAQNKVEAERQQLNEHLAALNQVQADFERQKVLYQERIVSQLKFQDAERKFNEARAKVEKAKALIDAAENDLVSKQSDRQAKEQKAQVDIDYATAELRKAIAEVTKAESDVAKAESEVPKAQKELLAVETMLARQRSQNIVAPFDGFVTRITPNQSSQVLKEGDPICVIVPDATDRAVQIWLDGNDAPLVLPGRMVRLQFEGWPAVQFAGWPSVAVGTFGGKVVSVDATDDGNGRFRILVRPDEADQPWPSNRFLRQGVRANGWVLLDQVPLWYEIWRNMNGFPPVVSIDEPATKKNVVLPKM